MSRIVSFHLNFYHIFEGHLDLHSPNSSQHLTALAGAQSDLSPIFTWSRTAPVAPLFDKLISGERGGPSPQLSMCLVCVHSCAKTGA